MRTGSFLVRYRWWIIISSILVTGFFGLQIFRAEINPDMETYIYKKMASRVNTSLIEEIFGGDEIVLILFESEDVLRQETLERIKEVNQDLKEIPGINETHSLFDAKNIRGEDGAMLVDPTIRRIPKSDKKREIIREDRKDDLESMIKDRRVLQVPAQTDADEFILQTAEAHRSRGEEVAIITNDRYLEYVKKYKPRFDWVRDASKQFMFVFSADGSQVLEAIISLN